MNPHVATLERPPRTEARSGGRNGLEIVVAHSPTSVPGELGETLLGVELVARLRRTDTGEVLHETARIITRQQFEDAGPRWAEGVTADCRSEFARITEMLVYRARQAPVRLVSRLPAPALTHNPALVRLVGFALVLWGVLATVVAVVRP
jgi:hypothetical protein